MTRIAGHWRGLVVPAALLALWSVASAFGWGNPHILVSPRAVIAGFGELTRNGDLHKALLSSLARMLCGWGLGAAPGLALGLALGLSRWASALVAPSVDGVRQIALFAWIPLLTAWAGNGEASKLCLIALAAFFPVARIVLPAAAPTIAAGLRIALAAAWIGTIGAEYMIENGRGLGMLLEAAREASRMDEVVIGIAVLALTGLALDRLLRLATGRWVSAS